jgi:hypothetical protein
MFGIKMPWTRRRERLLEQARAEREAARKQEDEDRKRRMEAARKEHERYTRLLIERERGRAERAEKEAQRLREAQESVRNHDLFGSPTPAIEFPRWTTESPVSREWDSTGPAVFKAGGGSFDGGGSSGDWSRSDAGNSGGSDNSSSSSDSGSSGSSGGGD